MTAGRQSESGALSRLRDWTGELRLPPAADYAHLLRDDGRLDRSEQLKIMERLLPHQTRASVVRFALMLTLSVTIAVMGLGADSVAVVIGAMLVAPLMTPIMSFAAAVGLGLGKRAVQAAFLVGVGSVWCVLFAMLLTRTFDNIEVGAEVLGRTKPDVRDLVVAIAAGVAGAYATAREDVSAALPGVAVAVALVPPLAATGMLIESDRLVLAEGSALLFLTNLFAIIVSALIVFLATGVIPTIRLAFQSSRIAMTTVGIILATVVIAVPLTSRSREAAASSRTRSDIEAVVDQWIGDLRLDVESVDLESTKVVVEVAGPDEPPAAYELARLLVPQLGESAEAVVRWDQRALGEANAGEEPVADPGDVARGVVESWLDGLQLEGVQLTLEELTFDDGDVDLVVSGPTAPPPAPSLSTDIANTVGADVSVSVLWIQSFDPELAGEPPAARLERVARAWIGPRSSVRLVATSIDGGTAHVDLGADGDPTGVAALRRVVLEHLDDLDRVEVRIVPLEVMTDDVTATTVPPLG